MLSDYLQTTMRHKTSNRNIHAVSKPYSRLHAMNATPVHYETQHNTTGRTVQRDNTSDEPVVESRHVSVARWSAR